MLGPLNPLKLCRLCVIWALLALLPDYAAATASLTGSISAKAAYAQLLQTGVLSKVTVEGVFDLGELKAKDQVRPPLTEFKIDTVVFTGPFVLSGQALAANVRIQKALFQNTISLQRCGLKAFAIQDSIAAADVLLENCRFDGAVWLDNNRFQRDVKIHFCQLRQRTGFRGSVFSGRAEFLASEIGNAALPAQAVSFSNVLFQGPAIFNNTRFVAQAKFQSAEFENDAAFLGVKMPAGASFRNVHFNGDAEFRFCRLGKAGFGDKDNVTVFAQRADFRGCSFDSAVFDYAEFRGKTSFVDAEFAAGGASFRYANFEAMADFSGMSSQGPLYFQHSYFPALNGYWRDFKQPLTMADTDALTLSAFQARFEASGDKKGALDLSYDIAKRHFAETVAEPLPSLVGLSANGLDAWAEQLMEYLEWSVWGWPTGYGTKFGRIVILALVCWLIASLSIFPAKQLLVKVPATVEGQAGDKAALYQAISLESLPLSRQFADTLMARWSLSAVFMFSLMFKTPAKDIRFVALPERPWRNKLCCYYFRFLWWFGSALLVLISLTLANTSPLIKKLLGELLI